MKLEHSDQRTTKVRGLLAGDVLAVIRMPGQFDSDPESVEHFGADSKGTCSFGCDQRRRLRLLVLRNNRIVATAASEPGDEWDLRESESEPTP